MTSVFAVVRVLCQRGLRGGVWYGVSLCVFKSYLLLVRGVGFTKKMWSVTLWPLLCLASEKLKCQSLHVCGHLCV